MNPMKDAKPQMYVGRDREELSQYAALQFTRLADEFVETKGRFTVALSGGSTPRSLYAWLAGDQFRDRISWSKTHLFWGDERCVPPDHADSNYRMVKEALLSKVFVPPENSHRMPAEKKDPERAADEYAQAIREFFKLSRGEWQLIKPAQGRLLWIIDRAAASALSPSSEVRHDFSW
jgi:6-phosphogluconolactonase